MKHNRRMSSPKQITYANNIARELGIDVVFDNTYSFYQVSKFISENVERFKEITGTATERQIDFANHIADVLQINAFFDDNANKYDVKEFIDNNIADYYKLQSDQTAIKYREGTNDVLNDENARHFLYDNLFKKHGVYAFVDKNGRIVYIGKSVNLCERIPSSYDERKHFADITRIFYYTDENMGNVNVLEVLLICENAPILNGESNSGEIPTMFHSGLEILKDFKELPLNINK